METAKLNVGIAFKNALPSVTYTGVYNRSEYEREITKEQSPSNRSVSEKVDTKGGYTQK